MTRVLFDVNVVLDVLLDRRPHVEASAAVWAVVESGGAEVTMALLWVFRVAAVDGSVIQDALQPLS